MQLFFDDIPQPVSTHPRALFDLNQSPAEYRATWLPFFDPREHPLAPLWALEAPDVLSAMIEEFTSSNRSTLGLLSFKKFISQWELRHVFYSASVAFAKRVAARRYGGPTTLSSALAIQVFIQFEKIACLQPYDDKNVSLMSRLFFAIKDIAGMTDSYKVRWATQDICDKWAVGLLMQNGSEFSQVREAWLNFFYNSVCKHFIDLGPDRVHVDALHEMADRDVISLWAQACQDRIAARYNVVFDDNGLIKVTK